MRSTVLEFAALTMACWAEATQHIGRGVKMEFRWERHLRKSLRAQAPHTMATLALEVWMEVMHIAMTIVALAAFSAKGIARLPEAILDAMHQVLLPKESESTIDGTLVDSAQTGF